MMMMCSGCTEKRAQLLCGGCEKIGYCSNECQSNDWHVGHHLECEAIGAFFSGRKKKKEAAAIAAAPQRKSEAQVLGETCVMAKSNKVSFIADVDAFEDTIIASPSKKGDVVERLLYGNTLEADMILNQVVLAFHGACSDDLARSLHLSFGNDTSLNKGAPFAWANLDETPTEVEARVGPTRRLKTSRISHNAVSSKAALGLAVAWNDATKNAEVFKIDLDADTALNFRQALTSKSDVEGSIFLRTRVRVRFNGKMREFLLKGQMRKLPRKGIWWLWVIEGSAVEAAGEFIRFSDSPVRAALILKARVGTDGFTISVPTMYFVVGQ